VLDFERVVGGEGRENEREREKESSNGSLRTLKVDTKLCFLIYLVPNFGIIH
jgi:hypothetical protein